MTDWIEHNGKGVPKDAIPGVTLVRGEMPDRCPGWSDGCQDHIRVVVWKGNVEPWDWSYFGTIDHADGMCWSRVVAYRNPSTDTAVESLRELIKDVSNVKELVS